MTLSDFPVSLDKKITLLKYFRNYMTEHLLNVSACGYLLTKSTHQAILESIRSLL